MDLDLRHNLMELRVSVWVRHPARDVAIAKFVDAIFQVFFKFGGVFVNMSITIDMFVLQISCVYPVVECSALCQHMT